MALQTGISLHVAVRIFHTCGRQSITVAGWRHLTRNARPTDARWLIVPSNGLISERVRWRWPFRTTVSPLGRFLPRLGPFDLRTAFFHACLASCRALGLLPVCMSLSAAPDFGRAALQKTHLIMLRRTRSFCIATWRARLVCRSPPWAFPP